MHLNHYRSYLPDPIYLLINHLLQIRKLPQTRMQSINDRVINVPIQDDDIVRTVTCLPRTTKNDGYITVNLKRMKSLKRSEIQETVKPDQLFEALESG